MSVWILLEGSPGVCLVYCQVVLKILSDILTLYLSELVPKVSGSNPTFLFCLCLSLGLICFEGITWMSFLEPFQDSVSRSIRSPSDLLTQSFYQDCASLAACN